MTLYLLHHFQIRAKWEFLNSVSQLFKLYQQFFSLGNQLIFSFLFGLLHYLENNRTIQDQIIHKKIK